MSRFLHHTLPAIVLFFYSVCACSPAKASHAAGAELTYEWVSDSTYRFYFKFYRDCSGIPADPEVALCFHSDCQQVDSIITLYRTAYLPGGAPNGTPVNTECPGFLSTCSSVTSTVPNYEEWWYTNTITLPYKCDAWHFDALVSARNNTLNIPATALTVSCTLNNITAPDNSSPYFSVKPVSFICFNQPFSYNNGAVDPDGDSLHFELVQPQGGSYCDPLPLAFLTGNPSYNLTNNPFQTNNSFILNAATGQMNFTPTLQGANVVALKASEYRNGQLISSVMRDIQLMVLPCNSQPPQFTLQPATVQNAQLVNGQLNACVDKSLSFCFKLKAGTPGTIMVAADNHSSAAPGSAMTYTGQQTDSIYGCFSWTPGPLDTGLISLTITAKDSSCISPGIVLSQTFSVPIYIAPSTSILRDTTICLNQTAQLFAYGGAQFTWTVLPGGSGIGSLSCTQCSNPIASPTVTTSYVVTSNLQSPCGKNIDTVTVTVNPQQGPPTPTASSNSPACEGGQLQLNTPSVPGVTYSWTGPSGFYSTSQNPSINNVQLFHGGLYTVQLSMNGCKSLPATTLVSVIPPPVVVAEQSPITVCAGAIVPLNALSPTPGLTYSWTGPQGYTSTDSANLMGPVTVAQSGTYFVTAGIPGCFSQPDSVVLTVLSNTAPVVNTPVVYCQYDQPVPLSATGQNLTWYVSPIDVWGSATAPTPSTAMPGTYVWFVSSRAGSCESSRVEIDVIVHTKPMPPLLISSGIYCEGEPITPLSTTGFNVLWYTQPTGGTGSPTAPIPNANLPGVPQTWYVTQTTAEGCVSDRGPVSVVVNPKPAAPGTDSVFYCLGAIATPLTALGQDLKWYTGATGGTPLATVPIPSTNTPGVQTWYVTQTIGGCEGSRAPLVVTIFDKINIDIAISRDTLCALDTLSIWDAGTLNPANNFSWSFDGATVLSGTGSGPYLLKWTTSGNKKIKLQVFNEGCTATDSVLVDVLPVPANDFNIQPDACINDIVHVQAGWDVPQDLQYDWTFGGAAVFSGSGRGSYTLSWHSPGVKVLSLHTDNGLCGSGIFYDTITVHDYPEARIISAWPHNICSGDPVTFNAAYSSGYHYVWQPARYFAEQDSATVTAPVTNIGIISLTVTDPWGCTAADSIFIETKPCCTVSLPDAFTPNSDGRNDIFRIITIGHHQLSTFRILNRWGQTVFETANESHGWDGTLGGQPQETGTYFYYLKFKCADGSLTEQKGSLMLIR